MTDFFFYLYIWVSSLTWVAQAYLDIKTLKVQALYAVPVGLTFVPVRLDASLTSLMLLSATPLLYSWEKLGNGEATLYFLYIISTIHQPILALQILMIFGGFYILTLQEKIGEEIPLAPAFTISYFIYLLAWLL